MEVEEMLNKVREQQGRAFDVKQLTTSCVANVIMNMLFGRRFDHSDPAFQQIIFVTDELTALYMTVAVIDIFPILRFVPYFRRNVAELMKAGEAAGKWIKVYTCSLQVCYSASTFQNFSFSLFLLFKLYAIAHCGYVYRLTETESHRNIRNIIE